MNTEKLKTKIFEKRKSYSECAAILNISIASFSNKMNPNNYGKPEFKMSEALKLSTFLNLSDEESLSIFFNR